MNALPGSFLEELRARIPLPDLIAGRVRLKRSGRSWRGACPLHGGGGKSDSFSVRATGFRCFSCGEHGDQIAWTMKADGLAFRDAVARLAGIAGLAMPDAAPSSARERAQAAREAERRGRERAERERREAAEQAASIAEAQALWRASVPIAGTLGARYLVETRGLAHPATGWPEALRFHPGKRALVAALTTPDGAVQAVHRIHLTADAENARRRDGRKLKLTRGVMAGAAIRLAGGDPSSGIVAHAEGLETGLSVIGAVRELRIYAGKSGWQPERDALNLFLLDDDPERPREDMARAERIAAWRRDGYRILEARPYAERRHDGSDWNDLLQREGADAVRMRLAELLAPPRLPTIASGRTFRPRETGLPALHPPITEPRAAAL